MKYQELRRKYPRFIYEKYEYELSGDNLEIKFYYSIPCLPAGTAPDHKFTHKIIFENVKYKIENLENLVFQVGLSIMPSYWKLTCSPVIEIQAGQLPSFPATPKLQSSEGWWHKLFIKGMGEYFYQNQIDFTPKDFLKIINTNNAHAGVMRTGAQGEAGTDQAAEHLQSHAPNAHSNNVLIPIGGGKDSIVTLELLKPRFKVIPFIINPVPVMLNVCQAAGLKPIVAKSILDPYLLKLNQKGYLNGHVPVSAFYSFASLLTAHLTGCSAIVFSNERSSNEGNTTYLGHEINHQYSKTLEFETDFNSYLKLLSVSTSYFSFLRPLYELQITRLFSKYPQYFQIFSSCNQNFKLTTSNQRPATKWCTHCPKCVSTALMLACFIGKDKVTEIMGAYPPELPENSEILKELLGQKPVKPFECVLTRAEARAAFTGQGVNNILSAWLDNPNMPEKFSKILKYALTHS